MSQETKTATNIPLALRRVLAERQGFLKSMNNWAKISEAKPSTVRDAFNPDNNTTLETLSKLAKGAGLTLAEMLEYGDLDWENKIAARRLIMEMTSEEIEALRVLLSARTEKKGGERHAAASETSGE